MIHIDRVNADVEVLRSPADLDAIEPAGTSTVPMLDALSMDRLHRIVMEVLREHLRDLERRGVL